VSWSPPKASSALIVATVLVDVTDYFAFRATRGLSVSIRMKGGDLRRCEEFLPITVNLLVELFKILNDP
jgi:hypothetical protein